MTDKPKMTIEDALIELYINIKIRDAEEVWLSQVNAFTDEMFNKEKEELKKISPFEILDKVQTTFTEIMNQTFSDKTSKSLSSREPDVKEIPKNHEEIIQHLEAETRSHIRVIDN